MMLSTFASAQQNLRSGYFLDGYIYKYKTNPAMAPERGFFAMPVLGDLSLGAESNLGLSKLLYPTAAGSLTTFLSPEVSNETFLNNISEKNKLKLNVDMSLIAFGFQTGKSYHTVDLSMRIDAGLNLPGSLLRFLKVGGSFDENTWNISNLGVRSTARMELAYGYSRSIGEALRVGGRAKLLFGVYRLDVAMDKMSLEMGYDRWAVDAHGNMMVSAPISFGTTDKNIVDWASINTDNLLPNLLSPSIGLAFDLGATYDFLDYFTASLSVNDLGFMSWKNTMFAETPETSWEFEGFDTIKAEELGEQFSLLTEDLIGAFNFEQKNSYLKKTKGLGATINAGVEARMPFYERLSFGMLYTQRIEGAYSWSEGRLAASVAPANWFSITTNYAISNYGHSWGGAFNIHLPGFGLFAGFDSFVPLMNVTPQMIPVNSLNTNLALGINFSFGKYNGRFQAKSE